MDRFFLGLFLLSPLLLFLLNHLEHDISPHRVLGPFLNILARVKQPTLLKDENPPGLRVDIDLPLPIVRQERRRSPNQLGAITNRSLGIIQVEVQREQRLLVLAVNLLAKRSIAMSYTKES